jgi:hypothetical protein
LLCLSLVAACGGGPTTPTTPATPTDATSASSSAAKSEAPPKPTAEAPKEEPKAKEPEPPKALEPVPPTVKVLDAGAAPKRALRYKFKAGVTEYVDMDMKMSMSLAMGGKQAPKTDLPTVRTTMKIEGKEVTPEGDLRCTFSAEKVDVLKDVQIDPKMRQNLEHELSGLVGMHGKARISTRGVASETEFELPPQANARLKSQMDSMRDAIRQMYVPFPEEEVGKGAKWEVTSRVPLSGAMMDTKMLYNLIKADGDVVNADVETTLSAPPNQPMQVGALPPGATAMLESLSGKGSGKVAPSLVRLAGSGTNKISMESTFSVAMQGEKMQMKMQSDVAVSSKPGKAPAPAAAPKK